MPAKLIRSLNNITPSQQGGVVTIGNFDGVHIGHQHLLAQMNAKARDLDTHSLVVTFEPHPAEFFNQENLTIPRLTRLREKFFALANHGIDNVLILKFNQHLATLSASDFITEILYQHLQPKHIIVGDDFRFGHKRLGDLELLQRAGHKLGFSVSSLTSVLQDDVRVSSTRVRKTLIAGDLVTAKCLLGRPYTMLGRVGNGDKLGRQLGFPTANIFLHRKLTPVKGVFTVLVHGLAEKPLPGAANVGTRPTVNGTRTLLEVHLLDFNQDIYGHHVSVEFCEKLRDEEKYPNLELLKEQIANDVNQTRNYFLKLGYL